MCEDHATFAILTQMHGELMLKTRWNRTCFECRNQTAWIDFESTLAGAIRHLSQYHVTLSLTYEVGAFEKLLKITSWQLLL